jgi:hypothetical protein
MRGWIFVLFGWAALSPPASADIIIDDLNDTASAGGGFVERRADAVTENVGPFGFDRTIGIGVTGGNVVGGIDVNVSIPSHVTMNMVDIIPTTTTAPLSSIGVSYEIPFPEVVDLTEGGKNDTLFFDFRSLNGETPPPLIQFFVGEQDEVLTYEYFYFPVLESTEPFTIAIPRQSFRRRGGGPETASFDDIYSLSIAVRANENFGAPEELGWQVILDRIRVGTVPEPSGLLVFVVAVVLLPRRLR